MATRKIERPNPAAPASAPITPVASRPHFPKEYAAARTRKGVLPWSHVSDRMRDAPRYWICTVNAEGCPDARPVDGLWLDDCLYFGGSPATRWRRNLSANPAACIHLENTMDVVTLQGFARLEEVGADAARELARASKQKYGYAPKPEEYMTSGVLCFRPRLVFAWTNLGKDPTKWEFPR